MKSFNIKVDVGTQPYQAWLECVHLLNKVLIQRFKKD